MTITTTITTKCPQQEPATTINKTRENSQNTLKFGLKLAVFGIFIDPKISFRTVSHGFLPPNYILAFYAISDKSDEPKWRKWPKSIKGTCLRPKNGHFWLKKGEDEFSWTCDQLETCR